MTYQKPILIFGAGTPLLLALLLTIAVNIATGNVEREYETKANDYKIAERQRAMLNQVIKTTAPYQPHADTWEALLTNEISSQITSTLKQIQQNHPSDQLQQTSFSAQGTQAPYHDDLPLPSTQIKLSFRGKFFAMQQALVTLETQLPHLHLEHFKITQKSTTDHLNFDLRYTVWKN